MANTLTCGEMKDTKFFGMKIDENGNMVFVKAKAKKLEKNEGDNAKEVYQIRPGARILRLDDAKDLESFKKEWGAKLGKDFSNSNLDDVLKAVKGVYDGVMVGNKLADASKGDNLLENSGIKILNDEVIVKEGDPNAEKSYRECFKADGGELGREIREATSALNDNIKSMQELVTKYGVSNTSFVHDKGRYMYNGQDITKEYQAAVDKISSNEISVNDKVSVSHMHNSEVALSGSECMRIYSVCNSMEGANVSLEQTMQAMAIYTKVEADNLYSRPNHMLQQIQDDKKGSIVTQNDQSSPRVVYEMNHKEATKVTKEALKEQQQMWNKVIEQADPKDKEAFMAVAQAHMCNVMNQHKDVKANIPDKVNLGNLGDISIKDSASLRAQMEKSARAERRSQIMSKIKGVLGGVGIGIGGIIGAASSKSVFGGVFSNVVKTLSKFGDGLL